jgi:RNA polymerase sigma-70 factor, ECF subfamily
VAFVPRLILVGKTSLTDGGDDVALAEALIRRDPQATFVAWTRLHGLAVGTLRRLVGPGSDVDDLTQEVFLRFFRQVPKLRDPKALRSFLIGICLRVVRGEMRQRWLGRFLHLTDSGESPEIAPSRRDGDSASDAREIVRRYYAILARLSAEERSLYVARHVERLPLADVAALHGLSDSTARRRLLRVARRVSAMVDRDPALAGYLAQEKRAGQKRARPTRTDQTGTDQKKADQEEGKS